MDEKEIMHQLLTLFYIFQKRDKKAHSGMKFRDLYDLAFHFTMSTAR